MIKDVGFKLLDLVDEGFYWNLFTECCNTVGLVGVTRRIVVGKCALCASTISEYAIQYIDNHNDVYDLVVPYVNLEDWYSELDESFGNTIATKVDTLLFEACRLFERSLSKLMYERISTYVFSEDF